MAKIEVVKQQDLKDCGACSLACIIQYHGGYVPLEKIREDTCTTSQGTSAYHLILAAQSYGFEAVGVKVATIIDENIYLPAICHMNMKNGLQHFAVVYKVSSRYVYLMDPAQGKVKMKKEEFEEVWDHILIMLTPMSNIICLSKNITISSILINLLKKNKKLFAFICLINLFFMVISILSNFYFQVAIQSIQTGSDLMFLKFIIFLFFIIFLMKVIVTFLKNYYLNFLNRNIDVTIFTDVLNHIFHLPLKFMQNRTTGEIVSRVQELGEIKDLLADFFTNILLNSILIVGAIIVLYFINSTLFFVLCLICIIYMVIGLLFSKLIYQKVKTAIDVSTEFNATLVEHVQMNESIQHLNLIQKFMYQLEHKLILMLKSNFQLQYFIHIVDFLKNFIYEIGLFVVSTFGIYLIYQGKLELLNLVTFNSILLYLFGPIKDMVDLIPKFNYLKASFNKLSEFLNVEEEVSKGGLKKIENTRIKLEDVTYSYNRFDNILNHVSFVIEAGEKVFLKGKSGCGKSTICNLIVHNQDNQMGIIMIGNACKQDYDLDTLRQEILYVGQNEKLFTGTIRNNILCFRDVLEKDFLDVIKICQLQEVIDKRVNRLDSMINASLNNLSGGERQRIILARALLKKAKIIILDEALSEVNIKMEREIIDNILTYFDSKTIIYVSHKEVGDKFGKIIDVGEING